MSDLAFATLDVFTDTPFTGNPLAVVSDADGLTAAQMLAMAREFNLSETIFVMAPRDPAHRARVRIFFPTAEIPFAGHPTIGCAIHLACRDAGAGDFDTALVLEEEAGLVPVTVTRRGSKVRAEFRAPVLPHGATEGVVPPLKDLAAALGLDPARIGAAGHAPGLREGGPRFLYIPLPDPGTLAQAHPREPAWSRVMEMAAVDSAWLYVPGETIRARMFSPTAGIPEDPATGSAAAILAAQLLANGALPEGETRLTIRQGVEMGRPSEIGLRITVEGGALRSVHVSGGAVPISSGRIRRP